MVKIKDYTDSEVKLLVATPFPVDLIKKTVAVTKHKDFMSKSIDNMDKIIKYLLEANHTSVFEHIVYTFIIKGASRSFLAQITRHRMASYTSGSQHYQDYRDYGFKIDKQHASGNSLQLYKESVDESRKKYIELIENGIPNHEARQVLPNASENNLIVTINARSLINFFNLRLCRRNTREIRTIASKMYEYCINHFPELFTYVGPDCYMKNKCFQGNQSCGEKYSTVVELFSAGDKGGD